MLSGLSMKTAIMWGDHMADCTLKIWNYAGDNRTVDKDLPDLSATTITGTFRGEIDLINPVILVNQTISGNYAEITDFSRYYYIDSITCVRTGLYQIILRVDVLKTYRTEIKALPAYAKRAYNIGDNAYYNSYIFDNKQPKTCIKNTYSHNMYTFDYGNGCIILCTIGGS